MVLIKEPKKNKGKRVLLGKLVNLKRLKVTYSATKRLGDKDGHGPVQRETTQRAVKDLKIRLEPKSPVLRAP